MMSLWLINSLGLAMVAAIVWWFWLSKPRARVAQTTVIEIEVANGVYTPARIEVTAGKPVTLRFIRYDPTPCAQTVIFKDLDISRYLPFEQAEDIVLTPEQPGEYGFACEMNMYRGSLVVKPQAL